MSTPDQGNPAQDSILRFIGALAGLVAFVGVYGGLLRAAAFDYLDLPAYRAVSLISPEELFSLGLVALLPTIGYATLAVAWISRYYIDQAEDDSAGNEWRYAVQAWAAALILVPLLVFGFIVYRLELSSMGVLLAIAAVGLLIIARHVRPELDPRRSRYSIGWATFAVIVVVGAAISYFRTLEEPKLEPAAVLRKGDEQGLRGFLIAESGDAVYLAPLDPLGPDAEGVAPDEEIDHVIEIPRDQIQAIAIDEPAAVDPESGSGPAQALALLGQLRREDAGARKRPEAAVVETTDAVRTFAPEVVLARKDPSYPTDANFFLDNSELLWAHDGGCADFRFGGGEPGSWGRGRLAGDDPYQRQADTEAEACELGGPSHLATELTRPTDGGAARPEGLSRSEGFYLDLADDKREGRGSADINRSGSQDTLAGVPAYYESQQVGSTRRITYWFFFPLSRPPGPPVVTGKLVHEGDWERISVRMQDLGKDRWLLQSVRFHEHDSYADIGWSSVEKVSDGVGDATHPVVYSARGSHASYPRIGRYLIDVPGQIEQVVDLAESCGDCPVWETWEMLEPATEQDWYGFGGAWGDYKPLPGPLGPSDFKSRTNDEPGTVGGEAGAIDSNDLEGAQLGG